MKRILLTLALVVSTAPLASAGSGQPYSDYVLHCSGCHQMSGLGAPQGGIPYFPDSVGKIASTEAGRTYIMHVPGVVANNLTDARVAGVMNFVLDQWGGEDARHFSADEVTRRRAIPVGDVVAFRRQVVEELKKAGIQVADYPWP